MTLPSHNWIKLDGEPMTGKVPPVIEVMNENPLTPQQYSEITHRYRLFCTAKLTAVGDYFVENRQLADGSRLRCVSINGVDTVMVWPIRDDDEEDPAIYMETGQLDYSFPALENPTLDYPAKWRFADIPPGSDWLGAIRPRSGKQKARQPTPTDTHVLRDNIDSLAIGFPRQEDSASDDAMRARYRNATINKKLVCSNFPPSMFSGKLRLFMQAQYGAVERSDGANFPYSIELLGDSTLLNYNPPNGGPQMQFGFWSHLTMGLYSTADLQYYLLKIAAHEPGVYGVYAMPVRLSKLGKVLRRVTLRVLGQLTPEALRQREAYLFAEAWIDTGAQVLLGTYNAGLAGESAGNALAFGWKFNRSGSAASVVVVGSVGEIKGNTLDGRAKEIHLTITKNASAPDVENWTVSGANSAALNWLDGWGAFNLFAPERENSAVLEHHSYKITRGTVAPYNFSNVPIYGFYDKNDEWVTVRLSRTGGPAAWVYEQDMSGMTLSDVFAAAYNAETFAATGAPRYNELGNAGQRSDQAATYEKRSMAPSTSEQMTVSVGSWSFAGSRKNGSYERDEQTALTGDAYLQTLSYAMVGAEGYITSNAPPNAAIDAMWAEVATWQYGYIEESTYTEVNSGTGTVLRESGTFEELSRWAVAIPSGDCEAVHVATQVLRTNVVSTRQTAQVSGRTSGTVYFRKNGAPGNPGTWVSFFIPWRWHDPFYTAAAEWTNAPQDTSTSEQPDIRAFSRSLSGEQGAPSGSYVTLFTVSSESPFFNGTMAFHESDGGRYSGTEGFNNVASMTNSKVFAGWF